MTLQTYKDIEKIVEEVAKKICDLTGYGQTLHPNDIKPELRELATQARQDRDAEIVKFCKSMGWNQSMEHLKDFLKT